MEVQWNLHVHNWIDEGVIWVLNWDGRLVSAQCTYHSLLTPSMPYNVTSYVFLKAEVTEIYICLLSTVSP